MTATVEKLYTKEWNFQEVRKYSLMGNGINDQNKNKRAIKEMARFISSNIKIELSVAFLVHWN